MDSQKAATWLQILGNLGLLAGIVLVSIQINQATELTRLQLNSEWLGQDDQRTLALMGEVPTEALAKAIDAPETLTTAEILVLENYILSWINHYATINRFADIGLVDDELWKEVLEDGSINYVFGHPFGKAWWASFEELFGGRWGSHGEEFNTALAQAVNNVDPRLMSNWHAAIRSKLDAIQTNALEN